MLDVESRELSTEPEARQSLAGAKCVAGKDKSRQIQVFGPIESGSTNPESPRTFSVATRAASAGPAPPDSTDRTPEPASAAFAPRRRAAGLNAPRPAEISPRPDRARAPR